MSRHVINAFFFFLENVGAGMWVGALATFGFAVARPVFRGLPSVTLAGSITAQVLHRINLLEAGAAAVMAVAAVVFLLQADQRTPIRLGKTLLVVLMAAVLSYYGTAIMDRLEHLRTVEIRDFDHFDEATRALRDEFDRLHRLYTRLAQANLFMGLGFLLLSAFERK
jgi:hypothetical protein